MSKELAACTDFTGLPLLAGTYMRKEIDMEKEFEYEGYTGTVNYDKNCDYYTGEVVIGGKIYTYEGDTLEELREDFEDIIDSMIAFEEMDDEDSGDIR